MIISIAAVRAWLRAVWQWLVNAAHRWRRRPGQGLRRVGDLQGALPRGGLAGVVGLDRRRGDRRKGGDSPDAAGRVPCGSLRQTSTVGRWGVTAGPPAASSEPRPRRVVGEHRGDAQAPLRGGGPRASAIHAFEQREAERRALRPEDVLTVVGGFAACDGQVLDEGVAASSAVGERFCLGGGGRARRDRESWARSRWSRPPCGTAASASSILAAVQRSACPPDCQRSALRLDAVGRTRSSTQLARVGGLQGALERAPAELHEASSRSASRPGCRGRTHGVHQGRDTTRRDIRLTTVARDHMRPLRRSRLKNRDELDVCPGQDASGGSDEVEGLVGGFPRGGSSPLRRMSETPVLRGFRRSGAVGACTTAPP